MPHRTAVYILQFDPPVPEPAERWVRGHRPAFARTVFGATTLPAAMNRAVEHFLRDRGEPRILLLYGSAIPMAGGDDHTPHELFTLAGPAVCAAKSAARCKYRLTCGALRIDRDLLAGMKRPWFAQRLVEETQQLAGCPLDRLRERLARRGREVSVTADRLGRRIHPLDLPRHDPFAADSPVPCTSKEDSP
jgi:hypothetical protein